LVGLYSWAESDIGRKRKRNEDACYHNDNLGLFIVADGMGGHRGGEQASKVAVSTACATYRDQKAKKFSTAFCLEQAFNKAAQKVYQDSMTNSDLRKMGTTLSALAIEKNRGYIAHIGDSRIYRVRDSQIKQLTSDHSLVNEQVQAGIMSQEEARISSLRNIITRAIGHSESICADHFSFFIAPGDIFLLCTDGLNNMLLDSEILTIISNFPSNKAIRQLILEANRKGGEDNITVILVVKDSNNNDLRT
jgi:PPM family protein phosphatase